MANSTTVPALAATARRGEILIRSMYHERSTVFYARHRLIPAVGHPIVAGYPAVYTGLCVAVATSATVASDPAAVVTGPSFTHARTDMSLLRVDYLTEIIHGIAFARWAHLPCVIVLPAAEAAAGTSRAYQRRWQIFGDLLESLLTVMLADLTPAAVPVTVVRTDDDGIRHHLMTAVEAYRPLLTAGIAGAARPLPGGQLGAPIASTIEATAATMVRYLAPVLAGMVGVDVSRVVAVESLQQARLLHHAARIAARVDTQLTYVGHLPAPSITGRQRMTIAPACEAILLGSSASTNTRKFDQLREPAASYWHALWQLHNGMLREPRPATLREMTLYMWRLYRSVTKPTSVEHP